MPQHIVTNALYHEITLGVHNLEVLKGIPQRGYRPADFLIITTYGGVRGIYHTFKPETVNRLESFSRIRKALQYVSHGEGDDFTDTYLHVLHSDQEIVASLIVSKNPNGSTFVFLGYHGDIPPLMAHSIVKAAGNELIEGYCCIN